MTPLLPFSRPSPDVSHVVFWTSPVQETEGSRTTEKGVYPKTTVKVFMSTLKEALKKVENLTGRKPTPAQRDEAVAKYHVQCIDNRFPHPAKGLNVTGN